MSELIEVFYRHSDFILSMTAVMNVAAAIWITHRAAQREDARR